VCARAGYDHLNAVALRKILENCPMVRDGRGVVVNPESVQ
jgi:hypothetical protein